MTRSLYVLILAAGASSRMRGRDKLLEVVAGVPLIARIAHEVIAAGLPACLVLPPDRPLRLAAVAGLPLHRVIAEQARDGMAESLKAGLQAVPSGADVMVLLADLPEIDQADLMVLKAAHQAHPDKVLRATDETGKPGHPVIFPHALLAELKAISGDEGARSVLQRHADKILPVPLPGRHATTDLDTPEDWDRWRRQDGPDRADGMR